MGALMNGTSKGEGVTPDRDPTRNVLAGTVRGQVVQAGAIDQVHLHLPHDRLQDHHSDVPEQLPMSPRRFVGRDLELGTLQRWRAEHTDGPMVVVLSGPGGVGKTVLALRWLHEISEEFRDGKLFIELGGDSSEPVPPGQAVAWFLESLGVPSKRIPADPGQRAALFRSVTADRQLAVFLDNATSAAQVRALLPAGPGNVVIVTSRSRLSGLALDGGLFLEVAPMDEAESLTVLQGLVGVARVNQEPDAARRLVELCGGLPLAVSIVGARLSARPRRRLADEAATLVDDSKVLALSVAGDKSVGAVFTAAYAGLDERARELYRISAAHPGREFAAAVLAATLGWDETTTSDVLAELVDLNLLLEVDDARYSFHDLLRAHARQCSESRKAQAVAADATRRMLSWYLSHAVAADLVIHPLRPHVGPLYDTDQSREVEFPSEQDAMSWLERERANLRTVVDHAWKHESYELAWQMCEALWGLFLRARRYSDWIPMQRTGIASAERCGNRRAEARLRSQLGFAYAKLARYDEAVAENMRALDLADAVGDKQARATALSQLGRAAAGTQRLPDALRYFQQARDLHEELGRPRGIALNRRRIGDILTRMGNPDAAVVELRAAADTMSSLGDRTQHARTLQVLGAAHQQAGRHDLAEAAVREAWSVVSELGSPYYRAEVLAQVGEMAEQRGDHATASEAYRNAEKLYGIVEDPKADLMRFRAESLRNE